MVKVLSKELLSVDRPVWKFEKGVNVAEMFGPPTRQQNGTFVREIVQPEDFGAAWQTRQRYEIDAGRDSEPLVYQPFYNSMSDENFPSAVQINLIGPGGVVFNRLLPGGETKFATIGESSQTIPIYDYTVGLEYSERMFTYNEFWGLEIFERQAGVANNANLNHIHLYPILSYAYGAANQTAASAIGSTLEQKYLHTLEDAIAASQNDTTNRRNGPYALLCAPGNVFTLRRAISGYMPVGGGVMMQSDALAEIQTIVAYNGWTGTMAGEDTNYPGVSAGTCYLVSVNAALQMRYARSLIKFVMRSLRGNPDVSRLVAQQEILWSALGIYFNAAALVQEVTLPTS